MVKNFTFDNSSIETYKNEYEEWDDYSHENEVFTYRSRKYRVIQKKGTALTSFELLCRKIIGVAVIILTFGTIFLSPAFRNFLAEKNKYVRFGVPNEGEVSKLKENIKSIGCDRFSKKMNKSIVEEILCALEEDFKHSEKTLITALEFVAENQDVFEDDYLLRAVLKVLKSNCDHQVLLVIAFSMASKLILHEMNADEAMMMNLAEIIVSYETDPFDVGVKAAAINRCYWEDESRFSVKDNAYKIEISLDLVKRYPEKVLNRLYTQCFSTDSTVKNFKLDLLKDDDLSLDAAIDQNGVSRTFLTELFCSLKILAEEEKCQFLNFKEESDFILPMASKGSLETKYRTANVANLTDEEILEAINLAFVFPENAPVQFKDENGILDLEKVKNGFKSVQMAINLHSNEGERLYTMIGKIMGMCSSSNGNYVIGQIFSPALFDVICSIPSGDLNHTFKELNENTLLKMGDALLKVIAPADKRISYLDIKLNDIDTDELAEDFLGSVYDFDEEWPGYSEDEYSVALVTVKEHFEEIKEEIRLQLLPELKSNSTLAAIYSMAQGIASNNIARENWHELNWLPTEEMQKKIQGVFTPEALTEAINCTDNVVKNYFHRWIDENYDDIEKLKDFLFAVSGSKALGIGKKITVNSNLMSQDHLPNFHTCFCSIDVYTYPSYEKFKGKLESGIEYALDGAGFQFG